MFEGVRMASRRRGREEGEKPFWISFSDLMSALMVLFLVAMSVALLAVTKKVSDEEREDKARAEAIAVLMNDIKKIVSQKEFDGIRVIGNTIDFGTRGTFADKRNVLSPSQVSILRQFTPQLLERLRTSEAGKKWFKRAVVEGYASRTGTYLYNLNLSLERSERVLCELLRESGTSQATLSEVDRKLIATKFFVGGASFNSLRSTDDDSRRIEYKIEFKTRQEHKAEIANPPNPIDDADLSRALDPKERCPIQDR
jgi:outer membrane protein OmpA-like peptidoglycan-associated protein